MEKLLVKSATVEFSGNINYVLDTNILLHDPLAFKNFGKHHVIVPAYVLEELENKKKQMTRIGESARTFVREIMKVREESGKRLGEKIELENGSGGSFTIEMNHQAFDGMGDFSDKSIKDNRILSVAKNIYDERKEFGEKTIVISMDALMIAKVDVLSTLMPEYKDSLQKGVRFDGFDGQLYKHDRLVEHSDNIHSGVHKVFVESELISRVHRGEAVKVIEIEGKMKKDYYPSDFVVLKSDEGNSSSALARIKTINGEMHVTTFIRGEPSFSHVSPRNAEQHMLAEALLDSKIELICVRGEAGSGKTLMALAASIYMMEDKDYPYKKIMVGRPAVEMGNSLGFLPGDLNEKLSPFLMPIYDNLEFYFKAENKNELEKILASKEFLEIQALTHIRGRSLPNQLIIIDEAQNLSPHEVKTIISRAGLGTKIILVGDTKQIDAPYLDEINNGLTYVTERMKVEESVVTLKLEKTERSPLADLAVKYL